jgi:hypothetical protein
MKVRIPRRSLLGQYLQTLDEGTLATQVSHYAQMGFELAARGQQPVVPMAVPTGGDRSNRIQTTTPLSPAASAVVGDDFMDDIGDFVK